MFLKSTFNWVPSPILGLANAPIVETKFLELAMSLLDFSPRIPLGTFSILPLILVKAESSIYPMAFVHVTVQKYTCICTCLTLTNKYKRTSTVLKI